MILDNENKFDFKNESYFLSDFPNIHKYPATMLPQIGLEVLKELKISDNSVMLDPYCGSGSSFASGISYGLKNFIAYDLNPLAILITKVRFTRISLESLEKYKLELKDKIINYSLENLEMPDYKNIDYWFSKQSINELAKIRQCISQIDNKDIQDFFKISFSTTLREVSYTRKNEFKLFRIKEDNISLFNDVDVISIYFSNLNKIISIYENYYYNKLECVNLILNNKSFDMFYKNIDIVLTSPPYGDSKTTVAYGQFSLFTNEWLGFENARKMDSMLMGGIKSSELYNKGIMKEIINSIYLIDKKRAFEVSAFYFDLENSIKDIAKCIKNNGYSVYVVANRNVKGYMLPTDEFIKEVFCDNGFTHIKTYQRLISNKVMPSLNSPSNEKGITSNTMNKEYIVICKKID